MVSIRAVYRNGQFQLLDPVNLSEGQAVRLQILDEQSRVRETLSDILVRIDEDEPHVQDFDEVALQAEIDAIVDGVTLSDLIVEERRTGR
jgi:predicted DNA-binding antitoxin AbrB/MazE fold protein